MMINRALLKASWESRVGNDNRPRAGPWWLAWVWTALFSLAIAVPFTILGFVSLGSGEGAWRNLNGWAYWYGKNLIVSVTISVVIHLLFDAGRLGFAKAVRVRAWKPWKRALYFGGTPLLGLALGWPLGVELAGGNLANRLRGPESANLIAGIALLSLVLSALFYSFSSAKARQIETERRATEAQLRLLQGQIEPHFLFNTLANVQSLMDHDLPKAKQMLMSFTDYLRTSLTTLRNEQSAVAQELDLAQNYLQLLQGRMEDRLQFSINADEAARRQTLPPLLLQPLIENAVVHGLEPSVAGGTVRVTARVKGQQLVLEVHDDGRGLDAPARPDTGRGARPGTGMALSNIRERLLTRYGSAATLEVTAAHPGTLARITLPIEGSAA